MCDLSLEAQIRTLRVIDARCHSGLSHEESAQLRAAANTVNQVLEMKKQVDRSVNVGDETSFADELSERVMRLLDVTAPSA